MVDTFRGAIPSPGPRLPQVIVISHIEDGEQERLFHETSEQTANHDAERNPEQVAHIQHWPKEPIATDGSIASPHNPSNNHYDDPGDRASERSKKLGWQTRLEQDFLQSCEIGSGILAKAQLLATRFAPRVELLAHRIPRLRILQGQCAR